MFTSNTPSPPAAAAAIMFASLSFLFSGTVSYPFVFNSFFLNNFCCPFVQLQFVIADMCVCVCCFKCLQMFQYRFFFEKIRWHIHSLKNLPVFTWLVFVYVSVYLFTLWYICNMYFLESSLQNTPKCRI